jgi:hypothetical protein
VIQRVPASAKRRAPSAGALGHEHELGHRHLVELDGVGGVAGPQLGEELGVVLDADVGVKAAVKAHQGAPEAAQGVDALTELLVGEQVAALLAGELVEGAVVAAGHADVGGVDDGHHEVGRDARRVVAAAHQGCERLELVVAGLGEEAAGLGDVGATASQQPGAQGFDPFGVGRHGHLAGCGGLTCRIGGPPDGQRPPRSRR